MNIREVINTDYEILNILQQLKNNSIDLTIEEFKNYIDNINISNKEKTTDIYQKIFVIEKEDKNNSKLLMGVATIIIEKKLIHNLKPVAHIEDVVIDNKYRGQQYGSLLIQYLKIYAKNMGCYKIILDCNDENVLFYKKQGFIEKDNHMTLYF